jgi:hypothetical protein
LAHDLKCWKCGAALAALSLPLRRLEECPTCRAELHVCRMCVQFDKQAYQQCREPTVEEVRDKSRANFCDHYKPNAAAWTGGEAAQNDRARSELDKLFGK